MRDAMQTKWHAHYIYDCYTRWLLYLPNAVTLTLFYSLLITRALSSFSESGDYFPKGGVQKFCVPSRPGD